MSKEIRQMIDKVKNFKDFLNESKSVFAGGEKTYIEGELSYVKPKELGDGIDLDKDVLSLIDKIKTNGWVVPISITKTGFIVDGEHRYKALMELGAENIPVYIGKQLGSSGRLEKVYDGLPIRIDIPNK
jgi:hypothetical protein